MTDYEIGEGQIRVMRILWDMNRATVNDILDMLNRNEEDDVKRSTVQTFLRALVRKKLAGYDVEGRTFIYYPLVNEKEVKHHAFHNFLDHTFRGSMEGLVSYMIDNEKLSSEELGKIRKLLDEREE